MFICKECQKPEDRVTFFKSYGTCEVCGKTKVCNEVYIH
jgi:hypothetical protein